MYLYICVYESKSVSCLVVSNSATPWTWQAPLSMEFSRQEYWSGLPFPSSEDLPDPGIKCGSPALLQYFGHLMWRSNSLDKTLTKGKTEGRGEEGDRGWDGWMASMTQWTWVWANSRRWWRTGKPGVMQSMGSKRVRHDLATKQQNAHLRTSLCTTLSVT